MAQKKQRVYKSPIGAIPKIVNNFESKTLNQKIFYEVVKNDETDSILRLKKITLEYIKYIRTFLSIKIGLNE